jgi:TRAP-type mannitol/chloroaromatic compound transport system substrate-binding protein
VAVINRRKFLWASSAAAGSALAAPALAQGTRELKLVTAWPRDNPGLGTSAQRMADRITALSEGRLKVNLFAAGEMVGAYESFDAVASGQADMYHGVEYYWQDKHKAFPFFAAVPLGMTAHEMEAWVHFGGGQELWDELSGQFGVKAFLAGNSGVQMGGWYQEPVKSLDDVKRLKMRIPGLGGEVIKRLGGQTIDVPSGKIFDALKSGEINAAELVGPFTDMAFGFHNVLKNYMFPGFHEPGSARSMGINKPVWESLSASDQELIRTVAAAENDLMMADFNANNGNALASLIENHGVKLQIFPKEVWSSFAKVSREVVMEIGLIDDISQRILDSWMTFQKRVSEWQQVSDISYTAFRSITLRQ